MHGGRSPRGIGHKGFRGAGYAKDFPGPVAKLYKEALSDPELLSVRREVALLTVRLRELLQALRDGTAHEAELWKEILDLAERKGKLASREWKRLVDLKQLITAEGAMMLIRGIMEAVKANVIEGRTPKEILAGISRDLGMLLKATPPDGE